MFDWQSYGIDGTSAQSGSVPAPPQAPDGPDPLARVFDGPVATQKVVSMGEWARSRGKASRVPGASMTRRLTVMNEQSLGTGQQVKLPRRRWLIAG
jgi:hypothetical protein